MLNMFAKINLPLLYMIIFLPLSILSLVDLILIHKVHPYLTLQSLIGSMTLFRIGFMANREIKEREQK